MATGFQGEMQVNYTVRPMDPMGGELFRDHHNQTLISFNFFPQMVIE